VGEPVWLDLDIILEIHQMNLSRYGGASGLRDLGLLESAVNRPRWSHEFDTEADLHQFAAAYAFGIVKNHPSVDGNKRLGYVSACTFLRFNGWHVAASQADAVRVVLALASGELSEDQMAGWLRENSEAASVPQPTYPSP
jgi:death on curing protein